MSDGARKPDRGADALSARTATWLAWSILALAVLFGGLGFVLFLFPQLLPIDPDLVSLIGFSAVVGGAVTLVWRLRSGDDDDHYDDGAVV